MDKPTITYYDDYEMRIFRLQIPFLWFQREKFARIKLICWLNKLLFTQLKEARKL